MVVKVGHLAHRAARGDRKVLLAVLGVLAVANKEATVFQEKRVENRAACATVAVREGIDVDKLVAVLCWQCHRVDSTILDRLSNVHVQYCLERR